MPYECQKCPDGSWECGEPAVLCGEGPNPGKLLGTAYLPAPGGFAVPVEVYLREIVVGKKKVFAVRLTPPAEVK